MKVTKKMLKEVKQCCQYGHGASIFEDGVILQSHGYNDITAKRGRNNEWDFRLVYIDNPNIDMKELVRIIDESIDSRRREKK